MPAHSQALVTSATASLRCSEIGGIGAIASIALRRNICARALSDTLMMMSTAILAVAGREATGLRGAGLLLAYSAGLGLPFVAAALAIGVFVRFLKRFRYERIHRRLDALPPKERL